MSEHGIIYQAWGIRAILAGIKTQTRRIIPGLGNIWHIDRLLGEWALSEPPERWDGKEWPWRWMGRRPPVEGDWIWQLQTDVDNFATYPMRCPYGVAGDKLWARETWATYQCMDKEPPRMTGEQSAFWYRADGEACNLAGLHSEVRGKWRPSIHMPRWASRITQTITEIRVQRVQEITEEDAIAEGVGSSEVCKMLATPAGGGDPDSGYELALLQSPLLAYRDCWNEINGPESWERNPWVWAITAPLEVKP